MQLIDKTREIGALAIELPLAARVFLDFGIDFCCAGPRPVASACRRAGVNPDRVVWQIDVQLEQQQHVQPRDNSLSGLIDFVVDKYHRPLRSKLDAIEALINKIVINHGPGRYHIREGLQAAFANLAAELWYLLQQKEDMLFPTIISGNGRSAKRSIQEINASGERVVQHLELIHRLTTGLDMSLESCVAERALVASIKALIADIAAQFHIEQNMLYPRALRE
jgi:regulator of cell morphogenesis and NO signaling